DGVLDYAPGDWLTAVKRIDPADPVLAGHFPGNPIYPGALIAEALAQAAVALLRLDPANADRLYMVGGADGLRFRRPVRPGELVTLEVRLTRRTATAAVAQARATVDGAWVAKAELIAGSTRIEASS
ncbi:MAG TPA: hotdog domain-containing protein, partial [Oscillatoriaceae cyanobacterium]